MKSVLQLFFLLVYRESGVAWGRRGRSAGAARPGVAVGGGSAGAWRRRERVAQPRRPMEVLTSIYALLSGGVSCFKEA